ncbi:MAG: asparagine synthase (glutamine-hydrolyzing) [Acidiferrobacteraceae bacterium]
MCGIAGCWVLGRVAEPAILVAMANAIGYRGPDDSGIWVDARSGVGLAHRRLSIVDLSTAGCQPMVSTSGRFVIIFNGEVYNHLELRVALEAPGCTPSWRGYSDTETLLAAFEAWGAEATLKKTVGMFAVALWDRQAMTLMLARDRLGEKPLYYGFSGDAFLFGSELKALRAYPGFCSNIDRGALTLYLRHNYIPAPYSIYRDIRKLTPGTWLTLSEVNMVARQLPTPHVYWSVREVALAGCAAPFSGSVMDAQMELEHLLSQSVAGQMIADVPLGAFLSGGVDSSVIVALMQKQAAHPVKTFTIGFHDSGYNEAEHARAVAAHLGTEHTELYVTAQQAMAVIPQLPDLYDEPFADSSQIPTYLVSQLARQHVTVSLSGDGGDELFGGYNRYFWARRLWQKLAWLPGSVRAALAGVLTSVSPMAWNRVFGRLGVFLPRNLRYANPGDKLHKLAEILAVKTPEEIYYTLISHWKHPADVVRYGTEPPSVVTERQVWPELADFEARMMYLDQVSYLPDDILAKVDRAAMAVGLETRMPLLDHRVVDFSWTLPRNMKIRCGQGKWLLRQVLYTYVPQALMERPKMGFGAPLDYWLRGPLKAWAEDLLNPARLHRDGVLRAGPVQEKWREHISGYRNWSYHLWDVLMFQAWLDSHA